MLTTFCVISALLSVGAFVLSYRMETGMFWGSKGTRIDFCMAWGVITIDRLSQYRRDSPLRIWYGDLETPRIIAAQKRGGWWRGEARWERIGCEIHHRIRCGGFDAATGIFYPPFIWQHPPMPFVLVEFPIWAWTLTSLVLPILRSYLLVIGRTREGNQRGMAMLPKKNDGLCQNLSQAGIQQNGYNYWRLANHGGIVSIFSSLVILNGSHVLYVKTKLEDGEPTLIVRVMDTIALIGLAGGCGAFVVSLFFPTGRRRRQDTPKQAP